VVLVGKEASKTRDYCVAKNATHRAARPDPSPRKERLLRMTTKFQNVLRNSQNKDPESSIATGGVRTQAMAKLRTVDH
jgi:hypothetical protein